MTDDATKTLERFASRGRSFDIVVCDPPTFSHGPAGQFSVARDLAQLAGASAAGARAGRPAGVRDQLDQGLGGRSRPRARRGWRRRRAPTCASSSAWACRRTFPVAPGFPEGNYLKVAIAIRVPSRVRRRCRTWQPRRDAWLSAAELLGRGCRGPSPRRGTGGPCLRPISLKRTWPLAISRSDGHRRLVVAARPAAGRRSRADARARRRE